MVLLFHHFVSNLKCLHKHSTRNDWLKRRDDELTTLSTSSSCSNDTSPVLVEKPLGSRPLSPCREVSGNEATSEYNQFLRDYPEYMLTSSVDDLREVDYKRLDNSGETYLDYCGASLYPESLIRDHASFMTSSVLGNTHSGSRCSQRSANLANEARASVLSFFDASPDEYTIVFTANASAALKLVGESFPFTKGSTFVLGEDSHNSVHGIRQFAIGRNAEVVYLPATSTGGIDAEECKVILANRRPIKSDCHSLFALTGLSNISNAKPPLDLLLHASSLSYGTLLDAAALAPSSSISLSQFPVDAMAVSFYKMFGYPTGVGALVVKKSFLKILHRPWFSGGSVDLVQVPGNVVTRAEELHEQFEDGTISYLMLYAITQGLRTLSTYLPLMPIRLSALTRWLCASLQDIRHEGTAQPVVQLLSRLPQERVDKIGDESDTGAIISMIFFAPSGDILPNSFIEHAALLELISLRTGCMCNPGGAAALLGIQKDMARLYEGVSLKGFEMALNRELGVVRVSLGLGSNFWDAQRFLIFAREMGKDEVRLSWWRDYLEAKAIKPHLSHKCNI